MGLIKILINTILLMVLTMGLDAYGILPLDAMHTIIISYGFWMVCDLYKKQKGGEKL